MSLSGITGSSAAWTGIGASRSEGMKERMFARVDADGSGGIDKTELADMLAKIQKHGGTGTTGSTLSADDALEKLDANADGSLDADEMEGLRDLMPPPSSTMAFAQGRTGGAGGPRPPPPPDEGSETEDDAVGELTDMIKSLTQAIDGDGDSRLGDDEVASFAQKLVAQALARYGETASSTATSGSMLAAA